ncbi:electron transporter SCO1/SenC [Nitratireductor aestuarii]|uniref:Electron transporter SCO1/SenC n=1 Tax=Nitratireductor aestuarii TaxID=1735103 RepID=A0A916W5G8_9HYPH|nr:SCO family protein [Nitratireductor aestuarii]GGA69694.1 electron transporter SCO1/SenC [Nitratireductor aestuarii]
MRYIVLCVTAVLVLAAGVATYLWTQSGSSKVVAFGAPFELVDHNGEKITEQAFRGKPTAVFFGFTHCPEVCPTTLFELGGWIEQLGSDADKMGAYFVSIDPERDTPEVMKAYLGNFSGHITGITGEPAKVMEMAKDFRIFAKKVELENGDYTMDHTASVLLLDSDGDFFGTIAYQENPETALAKLKRLIREG